jgi:hypothetical protein
MGEKNIILLHVDTIFSKSKTKDLLRGLERTISWFYFVSKYFVARALSLSRFGHVTISGEWLTPTLPTMSRAALAA